MPFRDEDDADDYRAWQQDDDLVLFRIEQAERIARLAAPPTPEPTEDDRCGMCRKRRATTGGLCGACNASASEPAWMTRAWGG